VSDHILRRLRECCLLLWYHRLLRSRLWHGIGNSSIAADLFAIVANRSPLPSPSAAVVDSPVGRRAPRDSGMGFVGIASTPGPAPGCSPVWTDGLKSSGRFALHQISSSIAITIRIRQQNESKARILARRLPGRPF